MKIVYLLAIVILLVGCGPSAEQLTATMEAAQAQTQTAAPTSTPTLTPTITPSPTPSVPIVMGRLQLNFIPVDDKTIIPQPPYDVSLKLIHGEDEIDIQVDPTDGSFSVSLEPGDYKIFSITVQNEALARDDFLIVTTMPEFTVPSQPCHYMGTISFSMLRLPPGGTLEEQQAAAQKIINRPFALVMYSESGGVILPAFVDISGAGACPNLPSLPTGYDWKYLPESSMAVPAPADWFFLSEQSQSTWAYFISKEEIIDGGAFKTGLSIIVLVDQIKDAGDFVDQYPALAIGHESVTSSSEVETWEDGNLVFAEFESDATGSVFDYRSHTLIVGDRDTNIVYIFIFESPTDEWDQAWVEGELIFDNLQLFDEE